MRENPPWYWRWRVPLTGIGGIALFCASYFWVKTGWPTWVFALGICCGVAGLMLRMWATGWLVKNEKLTTNGPYRFTRNPLYLGTLLITFGQCLMSDVPWAPLLFPAMCLALYLPTMRQEEEFLRGIYGAEFTAYAERVPLLLPSGRALAQPESLASDQTFSWQRVRRCYKGFLGNSLVILIYAIVHLSRFSR